VRHEKIHRFVLVFLALVCIVPGVQAKADDFGTVVKTIEQFYSVKHKGMPFFARVALKSLGAFGHLPVGSTRLLKDAGSLKVAYFEDQEFNSSGDFGQFRASIDAVLKGNWSPTVQVTRPPYQEQTYIYSREVGDKFKILVVNIERREASVLQFTLSPKSLAKLISSDEIARYTE
jgi:hypothetical protein